MSSATWLMVLAVALYLYDAGVLLRPDELVLVRVRGAWRARFGVFGWSLGGREPWIGGLCTPWRPVALVRWDAEQGLQCRPSQARNASMPTVGRACASCSLCLLALVFVALPVCLFVYNALWFSLSVAALAYALASLQMLLIHRERESLGLSSAAFWTLCVESVACPPIAINAIRKATMATRTWRLVDVLPAVERPSDLDDLTREMARRVRREMEAEAEHSRRMANLAQTLARLEQGMSNIENGRDQAAGREGT